MKKQTTGKQRRGQPSPVQACVKRMRGMLGLALAAAATPVAATDVDLIDETAIVSTVPNDGNHYIPSLNSDGRYVVFSSTATTLTPNDTNNAEDIYSYDTQTGQLVLVSHTPAGKAGNSYSSGAMQTSDGSEVVFYSYASDLVAGDTNGKEDVFVWTRATGVVTRIAQPAGGESDGWSYYPRITPDGRYVSFTSTATNLVPGNGNTSIYRLDRQISAFVRVDTDAGGTQANGFARASDISDNGNKVLFISQATNLVAGDTNTNYDWYLKDLTTGAVHLVSRDAAGNSADVYTTPLTWGRRLSADGTRAVFVSPAALAAGSNTLGQVYLYDDSAGSVSLLSQNGGTPSNQYCQDARISDDGATAYFSCRGSNLVAGDSNNTDDVFARNIAVGTNTRISLGGSGTQLSGSSYGAFPTSSGARVGFLSTAPQLIGNKPSLGFHVFVRDMGTGTVTGPSLLAATQQGAFANDIVREVHYHGASVSGDQRLVAFTSRASNLVTNDTNGTEDVFVHDRTAHATTRASVGNNGGQGVCGTDNVTLTPDAHYLTATSCSNLLDNGQSSSYHVYRRNLQTNAWQAITTNADGAPFYQPHVSDDGRTVAFYGNNPSSPQGQVWVKTETGGTFGPLTLVSATPSAGPGNASSSLPFVSGNGRYVVFNSSASDLVSGDTNGQQDVYLRDLQNSTTERISLGAAGAQATGACRHGGVSGDGRYVLFFCPTWLMGGAVPTPSSNNYLYRRDRQSGQLEWVTSMPDGSNGFPASIGQAEISSDGQRVAFSYYGPIRPLNITTPIQGVVVIDLPTHNTWTLARGDGRWDNGYQSFPHFNQAGDAVVLFSDGNTLSPEDGNGHVADVFLITDWDRVFGGAAGAFENP